MNHQRDSSCFADNEAYTSAGNDSLEDLCSGFGKINLQNSGLEEIKTTINLLKNEYKSPNVSSKSPRLNTGGSLKGNEIVGDSDGSHFARLNRAEVKAEGSPLGNEVSLPVYLVPSSFPENEGELLVIPVRRSNGCQKEDQNIQMKGIEEMQMNIPDNEAPQHENSFTTCDNTLVTEINGSEVDAGENIGSNMENSVVMPEDQINTSYTVSCKELRMSLSSSEQALSSLFTESILSIEETAFTALNIITPEANGLRKDFASDTIIESSKSNGIEENLSFIEPTVESLLTNEDSEQCNVEKIEEAHIFTPVNMTTPDTDDIITSKDNLTYSKESESEKSFQNDAVSEVFSDITIGEDSFNAQEDTILVNLPTTCMTPTDEHKASSPLDTTFTYLQSNDADGACLLNTSGKDTSGVENDVNTCPNEAVFCRRETFQDSTCTEDLQNSEEEKLLNKLTLSLPETNQGGDSECEKFICDTDGIQGSVANTETNMEEAILNNTFTNISSSERVEELQIIATGNTSYERTEKNFSFTDTIEEDLKSENEVSPKETIIKRDSSVDKENDAGANAASNTSLKDSTLREELNATFSVSEISPDVTFTGIIPPNIEESKLLKTLTITIPEANRNTVSEHDVISVCSTEGVQGSVSNSETNAKAVSPVSFSEFSSSKVIEEIKEDKSEKRASEKYNFNFFSSDARTGGDIESEKNVPLKETNIKRVSDVHITSDSVGNGIGFETSMNNSKLYEEHNATYCGGETVPVSTFSTNILSDGLESQPLNPLTITSESNANSQADTNKISDSGSGGIPESAPISGSPVIAALNSTYTEGRSSEEIKRKLVIPSQNLIFQKNEFVEPTSGESLMNLTEYADNSAQMKMVLDANLNATFTEVVEPNLDELQRNYPVNVLSNEEKFNTVFHSPIVTLNSTFSEDTTPRRSEKAKNSLESNDLYENPVNNNSAELANTAEMKGNDAFSKTTEKSLLNITFPENYNPMENKKMQINFLNTSCEEQNEFLTSKISAKAAVLNTTFGETPPGKAILQIQDTKDCGKSSVVPNCELMEDVTQKEINIRETKNPENEIQMNESSRKSSEAGELNGTFIKMDALPENIIDNQNASLNSTFTLNTELSLNRTILNEPPPSVDDHSIEDSSSITTLNNTIVIANTSNDKNFVSKLHTNNFKETAENMHLSEKTSVSEAMEACVLNNFDLQPPKGILPLVAASLPRDDMMLKLNDIPKNDALVPQNSTTVQHVNRTRREGESVNAAFNEREQLTNVNLDFQEQTFDINKSSVQPNMQADSQQEESYKVNPCIASSDSNMTWLPPFEQASSSRQPHLVPGLNLKNEENCQTSDWNFLLSDEVFQDPSSFDFLTKCGNAKSLRDLRKESLYIKFDPLVGSPHSLPDVESCVPILNITEEEKSEKEEYEKRICALEAELQKARKEHELDKDAYTKYMDLEFDMMRLKEENEALKAEIVKQQKEIKVCRLTLPEYERLVSKLVVEKEQTSKRVKELELQKEEYLKSLKITEKAYSDVCGKYEILSCTLKKLQENEDHLMSKITGYQKVLETQKQNYQTLKTHAANQLESANEKILVEQNRYKLECTKLNSAIDQLQLRLKSVNEELQQKAKENKQLMAMCSELVEQCQ